MSNEKDTPEQQQGHAPLAGVGTRTDYDDLIENSPCEECPKCGRVYDDIDFDYQTCSKCGWDADAEKWTKPRQPTDEDYLNGDADISTQDWW
jgi:hypothetical protein